MKQCHQIKSKEQNLGFLGPECGHRIASSRCNDVLELGEATSVAFVKATELETGCDAQNFNRATRFSYRTGGVIIQ